MNTEALRQMEAMRAVRGNAPVRLRNAAQRMLEHEDCGGPRLVPVVRGSDPVVDPRGVHCRVHGYVRLE